VADVPASKRVRTIIELQEEEEPLVPKASLGHNRKHPAKIQNSDMEQVSKLLNFAEVFLAPEAGKESPPSEELDEMILPTKENYSQAKKPAKPIYELIYVVD
jgi:hypothetical protein